MSRRGRIIFHKEYAMKRLTLLGRSVALSAAAVLLSSVVAAGQTPTLGEVAKKEAERRKAQPTAGKVYTNKDLPASAQKPGAAAAMPAADPASPATPADPVEAAEQKAAEPKAGAEEKGEAYWKGRVTAAREELRRSEMFAAALQTRINTLNKDFASRDNPAQRARTGEERTEALTELTRVRQDVDRARKQIADIEEEARKSGVPPGWLR